MRRCLFIACFFKLWSQALAEDVPVVDEFMSVRLDALALGQAVHACFVEEKKHFESQPIKITPVFFSATMHGKGKITEYALCSVKALRFVENKSTRESNPFDGVKASVTFDQWFVLLARTRYESMELWGLCTSLEEANSRYNLASLKVLGGGKFEAHAVYDFLAQWGALGEFGSKDLWKGHRMIACSVDSSAWTRSIDGSFDLSKYGGR